jgi:hypothetical protein
MMMNLDLYLPLKKRINEMISTSEKCLIYFNKLQPNGLIERIRTPPNTNIHSLTERGVVIGQLLDDLMVTTFS